MNITEANAANVVLRYLLGLDKEYGDIAISVTSEEAKKAAQLVAARSHAALNAGLTADDVERAWPGGDE